VALPEGHAAVAARRGAQEQVEVGLLAVQPLHRHAVTLREPVEAGEVGLFFGLGVEPGGLARGQVEDPEAHLRIGGARLGVVLVAGLGVGRGVVGQQGVAAHGRVVEVVVGDPAAVRRPPEALRRAVPDLLSVHPVVAAVEDLPRLAVGGQGALGTPGGRHREVEHVEVALARVGELRAVGRQGGSLLVRRGLGQALEARSRPPEEEVAARFEDLVRAAGKALVGVQAPAQALEVRHREQALGLAGGRVQAPQGLAVAAVPQVGEGLAVGPPGDLLRPPPDVLLLEQIVERELRGPLGGAGGGGQGGRREKGEQGECEEAAHGDLR
jgi:hypothetical protein